ncbi:MAG: C10 family peptidase [Bacteroidales bacterium]|nr:C10 family peptidase [Bacteroidales bacterium]
MRKILISTILSLLIVFSAFAGQVNINEAKNVAKNFYWDKVTLSNRMSYDNINLSLVFTRSEGSSPVYYIFNVNQEDGFVIIAADDDVYPFLGYAFTGKYVDNIDQPINFKTWIDHSKDQILFVKENGLQADEQISEAWKKYQTQAQSTDPVLGVNPLLTTNWDQGNYYNALCPVDNAGPGGHVYAGCLATAMGQVMKYHNHPEQGTGQHSYYCAPYGTQTANFGATTYNWSSMPNSVYYNNTAVATLLFHCGVSVNMMYGPDGSGAWTTDSRTALINYFSYSSSAQYKQKSSYSSSAWENLLKTELEASRPMIYRGQGSGGGHAFVCDGYQGTNHFHFNWGWSGYYNGYFYVSNLNPGGSNLNDLQAAVIGIQPATLAPVADFSSDVTNIYTGDQVNFTDESTGNITSRNWTFYGGTPTTSTQQNPTITYNTAGDYSVILTVTGPGGSDSETKTNYITVTDLAPEYHFEFEGGDPSNPVWTIYFGGASFEGIDLMPDDEIAIFDGDVMVGVFMLDQVITMDNVFENDLIVFSELVSQPGYEVGNTYSFKCWDASEELEIESFDIELFNPYGDAFTGGEFPAGDGEYSIAAIDFLSNTSQSFDLNYGFQFISSAVDPDDPNMLTVVEEILNENLAFIRNSQGTMLRKIGPNWVNGIGNWIVEEGYLVKMNADDSFSITGALVDPATPISVIAGFQFVSYLPTSPMNALSAFGTIIGDDLEFIRNSEGTMIRKIGPNWVNGIGDCNPDEGYLVKMFAAGEIIYPTYAKSSGKTTKVPSNLIFKGGNPAEAVYSLYIQGLEIGDEVAAYDGEKMVGATRINSQNAFENELPVFSILTSGQGFEEGNPINFKVWSENTILPADFTMEAIYDSYVSNDYPEGDGKYSIVNITKGKIANSEETISVYPNPSEGIFNISFKGIKSDIQIRVLDLRGKEYYNFEFTGSDLTQLDLSELVAGVYFISFNGKDFNEVKKIVIQ